MNNPITIEGRFRPGQTIVNNRRSALVIGISIDVHGAIGYTLSIEELSGYTRHTVYEVELTEWTLRAY